MVIDAPHRRRNPLTGGWVLVSAGRTDRPWQGAVERVPEADLPAYDPDCYLCPGNPRAGGAVNPDYDSTFVFTNDFAALRPDALPGEVGGDGLFRAEVERGTCRVLCFTPRHDLTLARAHPPTVRSVVDLWADQTAELGAEYRWVQVFENRGEMMGASNPHPHGQIWAGSALPVEPALEDEHQRAHLERHGCRLLSAVAAAEAESGERVVIENAGWIAFVPFWAVWPFETLLVPKTPVARLPDLDGAARDGLVDVLRRLLARYDNLFEAPFPYSMGWHGAPFGDGPVDHWVLHAHVYPPLLRSATVRKFMVGYELLAEAQRDLTPEEAAARLRSLPELHFRDAG
jgi:UDPglucose--hexose-1-phosphate uridylyltransferase